MCTHDPDLARVNPNILPDILQTLYAVSGCDYISFFSELGKATFLKYFYQYATFITGGKLGTTGTLADTSLENSQYGNGFLSFLPLIGTIYFKKHSTRFDTPCPAAHYLKFISPKLTELQQHSAWLEDIR